MSQYGYADPIDQAVEELTFVLDESWTPVDLGEVIDGNHQQPMPTVLRRNDGEHLFYPGSINGVHGDSGAGKGWLVCFTIEQEIRAGHNVLLLDFEDTAISIVARLLGMGVDPDRIRRHVLYVRPQTEFNKPAVDHVIDLCITHNVTMVVVDSVGEAFALEGIDENKDVEVGPWYRRVARRIADTGPGVVLIDHSTKASDNPLHPSGSKRKRAAITGASYLAEAVKAFVKGEGGRLKLTCAKDRHGNYRKGEIVGNLVMAKSLTNLVRLELHEPDSTDRTDEMGVIIAARAAVAAAKAEGAPLSKTSLRGLMKVKASTDAKRAGLDLAITRGALAETPGPRGAKLVEYVHDLPEEVPT